MLNKNKEVYKCHNKCTPEIESDLKSESEKKKEIEKESKSKSKREILIMGQNGTERELLFCYNKNDK